MPNSLKASLIIQGVAFFLVFTVFHFANSSPDWEVGYSDDLLAYVTWVPAFWDGIPGGILTYITLSVMTILSFALSARESFRQWSLPLFHIFALQWSLFPCMTYQLGDYRGP